MLHLLRVQIAIRVIPEQLARLLDQQNSCRKNNPQLGTNKYIQTMAGWWGAAIKGAG
jgi:hypothetical protein